MDPFSLFLSIEKYVNSTILPKMLISLISSSPGGLVVTNESVTRGGGWTHP